MDWRQLLEAGAAASLNDAARQLERRFPEILWMGDPARPELALTFDDGPHERDTPALLAVLAHHGVTATFSWLGERAELRPDLIAAVARAGHQLMVHGYRHRSFLIEKQDELRIMLDRTRAILAEGSGRDPAAINSVRPPYGHLSGSILHALLAWGYQPVICSIMPVHWMLPEAISLRHVLAQTGPGSLIVLHESLGGAPVASLTDRILTSLAPRGYRYVTVDELRAGRQAAAGAKRRRL